MKQKHTQSGSAPRRRASMKNTTTLVLGIALLGAAAVPIRAGGIYDYLLTLPDTLVVSRITYDGNTFGNPASFPAIFSDPTVTGVQGTVHLDILLSAPGSPPLFSFALEGISTSFSSKSEGALTLSVDGTVLTYMGYSGPVGAEGVSNSYSTGTGSNLHGNAGALYDREVALIQKDGVVSLTPINNAYSGDNPRAAASVDSTQFYMVGNADSTIYADGTGPGATIGARYGVPGSPISYELGGYIALDRPDETSKQHVKDSNFRALGLFNGNMYVAKGSGGNGDDGLFQVHNGKGDGFPVGLGNTITKLFGAPATDPVTGAVSPYTPFGFWFANPTTVYVADEGYGNTDANGNLIPDRLGGLQKWILADGAWQLAYILTDGLNLFNPQTVAGYSVPTYTTGLRNLTGKSNYDGTVTIYAITAQYSSISGGEPDPTALVAVKDVLSATSLPGEQFVTLRTSKAGEVFRGIAFQPCSLSALEANGVTALHACYPGFSY